MTGRKYIRIFLFIFAAYLLLVALNTSVKRHFRWIVATTASHRYETQWFGGWFTTGKRIQVTDLEVWAREHDMFKGYDWRCVEGTFLTITNRAVGFGHGRPPEISELGGSGADLWAIYGSEQELKVFMTVMNQGTSQEKTDATIMARNMIDERVDWNHLDRDTLRRY